MFKFYIYIFLSLLRFIKKIFSEEAPLDEHFLNELVFYIYFTNIFLTLKGESIKSLFFNLSFKH